MKTKSKSYTVNKRFTVWVATRVQAESLAAAVAQAEDLRPADFMEIEELIDWDPMTGTSVAEDF